VRELEALALLASRGPDACRATMRALDEELRRVEAGVADLTRVMDRELAAARRAAAQRQRWLAAKARFAALEAKLKGADVAAARSASAGRTAPEPRAPSGNAPSDAAPLTEAAAATCDAPTCGRLSTPSRSAFDAVPRYVRGRVTYAALVAVVGFANAAAEAKRERAATWERQARAVGDGAVTFVSDEDVLAACEEEGARAAGFDVADATRDVVVSSALQCLRHMGSVRAVAPNLYVFVR